ncbi:MAG TPA: hypothetical protein VEZ24_11205 [Microvirga sp.]|nr:hypothetical protein [Microvirga sp.]
MAAPDVGRLFGSTTCLKASAGTLNSPADHLAVMHNKASVRQHGHAWIDLIVVIRRQEELAAASGSVGVEDLGADGTLAGVETVVLLLL